ncbi:MAG: SGNH/GDSL hydrolase family protein [Deltaproteobacteria bacterium]|nr:SGNH/GDSL hydrolase family protein [Deltaproteobacteria bacterium]
MTKWQRKFWIPLLCAMAACSSRSSSHDDAAGGEAGAGGAGGENEAGSAGAQAGGAVAGHAGGSGSPDAGPAASADAAPDAQALPYATCIMPLGDSITQADLEHMSYRYWLWQMLRDGGFRTGFVGSQTTRHKREANEPTVAYPDPTFDADHEGRWGKKPSEILALLKAVTTWDKQTPGIVLLHAGTNEVWTVSTETDQAIAQRAIMGIEALIDYLRTKNPNVVVLLAKVIPLSEDRYPGPFQSAIAEINARVPGVAERKTTSTSLVQVVDQFAGFTKADFLPDGIHPNEAGEKRIAAAWMQALTPLLQGKKTIACPL